MDDGTTPTTNGGYTQDESERFTQRLVLGFFAGIAALAVVFTLAGVVANASMHHHHASGAAAAAAPSLPVHLTVSGSSRRGPDGKMHDAFTVTNFAVHAGVPLKLVIDNTDDQPHSITALGADLNLIVKPGTHAYSLVVTRPGRYFWFCAYPCDSDANGWGMKHAGFMSGYITVT